MIMPASPTETNLRPALCSAAPASGVAILLGNADDRTKKAFFIDRGHIFGAPSGFFNERPGVACHLDDFSLFSLVDSRGGSRLDCPF